MLKPGDLAPDFSLECAINGQLGKVSLARQPAELTVLFFYPRDFSFICPTEVAGFQARLTDFEKENARTIGISVDDAACHLRWASELGGISYALVGDPDGATAKAYGVFDDRNK